MAAYNIYEAKMKLSSLVQRAYAGKEDVTIAKAGQPLVKLVSVDYPQPQEGSKPYRNGGQNFAGWKSVPSEVDDPLPQEMQQALGITE